jgi:hypothetical protein
MIAVALALALAGPAAGMEEARCILGRDGGGANLAAGAAAVASVRGRLTAAAAQCAAEHDWSPEAREAAQAMAAGAIVQDRARDALREERIDAAAIDRWLSRQSPAVREALALSFADNAVMMNELLRGGAPAAELALQVDKIRAYVAARAMIYRVEQELPLP